MTDSLTPPTGAVVDPATLNNGEGDAPIERVVAQEEGTPSDVANASRAFRERLEKIATAPETSTEEAVVLVPPAEDTRPRNPDGTFKALTDPEATPAESTEVAEVVEPKVFTLKGETQRGESDIELDITGLPPEVVERLERAASQGMRRAEYNVAMGKLRADRANLDAVETEIAVDPNGFVLNHLPPARRGELAQTLLLEHWDDLAPLIFELWEQPASRQQKITDIKNGITNRRGEVQAQVHGSRAAADVRAAVADLVPDTADDATAADFFQTSIALLQARAMRNEPVTPDAVASLLAAHRRRFFGADSAAATPPARPKIAVKAPIQVKPVDAPPATNAAVKAALAARSAALATAGQGAGAGAVQRPGGPADETVEQASKRIRSQARG